MDKQTLIGILKKDIEREARYIATHREILAILGKNKGKKYSARIVTAFKKLHPEWSVYDKRENGMAYIYYWGADSGFDYDSRVGHFIGYDRALESIDPDKFEVADGCHGVHAAQRNIERHKLIDDSARIEAIVTACNAYVAAKNTYKEILSDLAGKYQIMEQVEREVRS